MGNQDFKDLAIPRRGPVPRRRQRSGLLSAFYAVALCCVANIVDAKGHHHEQKHGHKTEEDFSSIINGLPPGFSFGAASAAYQIEGGVHDGGRGDTIWDTFCHMDAPKIANNATGDVACDSYHRYGEDADLAAAAGFDSYRLSIAWARIYPEGEGDEPNAEGIQYYHDVLNALISRGVEPMVTLYHWDLPQALEDKYGGWLSPQVVPAFQAYVDTCFKEYGGKVKKWITINEGWSFVQHGYSSGMHAPGRCSDRNICAEGDSFTEPYQAAHNVILAHAHAVALYRGKYKLEQGGVIGMTLNIDAMEPLDPESDADIDAALRFPEFQVGWFADPIYFGDYPETMRDRVGERLPTFTDDQRALVMGSNDFFGLNHYTSWYVTDIPDDNPPAADTTVYKAMAAGIELPVTPPGDGWAQDLHIIQTKYDLDGKINGMVTFSDWLTGVPAGFRQALKWTSDRYGRPPILVTENGMARKDEYKMAIEDAVQDDDRISYYRDYLRSMVDAIVEDGVDVRAYYAWSLLDNFEWSDGYHPRFGLTYVDYDNNEERHPKKSSKWFADLAKARRRAADDSGKYMGCTGGSASLEAGDGHDTGSSIFAGGGIVSSAYGFVLLLAGAAAILAMAGVLGYKIGNGSWRRRISGRQGGYEGV